MIVRSKTRTKTFVISIFLAVSAVLSSCGSGVSSNMAADEEVMQENIQIALIGIYNKRAVVYIDDVEVFNDVVTVNSDSVGLSALFRARAMGRVVFRVIVDGVERTQSVEITKNIKSVYIDNGPSDFITIGEETELELY